MLRDQLEANAAAVANDVMQVKTYLASHGITDVRVAIDGRLLQVSAGMTALQKAFAMTLRSVDVDGHAVYFSQDPVRIPVALRGSVLGVMGLDKRHGAKVPDHSPLRSDVDATEPPLLASAVAASGIASTEVVRHSVEELTSVYGADALAPASGVVGAIIASGNLENTLTRLQRFQTLHGLHTPVTIVTVGDPAAPGYRSSAASKDMETEWDMDTQLLVGSAGGLQRLIIYNIPDLSWKSMIDGIARATDDNQARVISMSIYASETGVSDAIFQAVDATLSKAALQGQNFLFCSGDDGIYQPLSARAALPYYDSLLGRQDQRQVALPASHRYAIAVGATELQTRAGSPATYAAERVWNAGVGRRISQGGLSKLSDAPRWQKDTIPRQVSSGRRGVPDVSFNGSYLSSAQILATDAQGNEARWYVWGTSAAAPTFAGYVARLLQAHPKLGFIGPQIYRYARQRSEAQRSHDVLTGTNGLYDDGYTAASGWDFASGWGSLDIGDFDRFLRSQAENRHGREQNAPG
ncbi:Pseudomonalisin [Xanthomonas hydrangeae]|nr:Pseudomonalisin [Xanthomonas hydrangeae]CAD7722868.1 Pseudomonalisin [Xanthomonas hydrangeae]CAD7727431.1 Pseudomonalisin [Xanthomonas hydrangeae]CAD7727434.1 Pseudomonalisin [Xanthomonas hydrangeae]